MKKRLLKIVVGVIFLLLGITIFIAKPLNFTGAVIGLEYVANLWFYVIGIIFIIIGILMVRGKVYIRGDYEKVNDLVSLVKNDPSLSRIANSFKKNDVIQKDINHLLAEMVRGNVKAGIAPHQVYGNVWELRASNGGRVYYRKGDRDKKYEILAYSDKHTQDRVINRLKRVYP